MLSLELETVDTRVQLISPSPSGGRVKREQADRPLITLTGQECSSLIQLLKSPDSEDFFAVGLHNDRIPMVDEAGLRIAEQVVSWEVTEDTAIYISKLRVQLHEWQDSVALAASDIRVDRQLTRRNNSSWQHLRPGERGEKYAIRRSSAGQRNRLKEKIAAVTLEDLEAVEQEAIRRVIEQGNCPLIKGLAETVAGITRRIELEPVSTKRRDFPNNPSFEKHWNLPTILDPLSRVATGLSLVFSPSIATVRVQLDNPTQVRQQSHIDVGRQVTAQNEIQAQHRKQQEEVLPNGQDRALLLQQLVDFWVKAVNNDVIGPTAPVEVDSYLSTRGTAVDSSEVVRRPPDGIIEKVLNDFATFLGIPSDQVNLSSAGFHMWSNSGAGCDIPGQSYYQVMTPGWQMTVEAIEQGRRAIYHTNNDPDQTIFCRLEPKKNQEMISGGEQHVAILWSYQGMVDDLWVDEEGTLYSISGTERQSLTPVADSKNTYYGANFIYGPHTPVRKLLYRIYWPDGKVAGYARPGEWPQRPEELPQIIRNILGGK